MTHANEAASYKLHAASLKRAMKQRVVIERQIILFSTVVRRFSRNLDIMRMAFRDS
jgi:hypothetical protein